MECAVVVLVFLSAVTFSLETLPDLSPRFRRGLAVFEVFSVFCFTGEYAVRLMYARPRRAYAFSFFGWVDLLAILPFFLSLGFDLRAIRLFRLFRIFRLFKLTKYVKGMNRLRQSFQMVREELFLFFFASGIVIYLLAMGIYHFEHQAQPDVFRSVFDGIWWAVCTLTTVGYGDAYPVTLAGRMFTVVILLTGLGVVAVPTGLISSALSRIRDDEQRQEMSG
ncbi:MAG: ion transporter [Verrucomicrobia bacterium]|nr:ion transporter [Verrucomicrobiota bacterium]